MTTTSPRRALTRVLPVLAREYGLRPWDVDALTSDEVDAFLGDLRDRAEQRRQQQRQRRGGTETPEKRRRRKGR